MCVTGLIPVREKGVAPPEELSQVFCSSLDLNYLSSALNFAGYMYINIYCYDYTGINISRTVDLLDLAN